MNVVIAFSDHNLVRTQLNSVGIGMRFRSVGTRIHVEPQIGGMQLFPDRIQVQFFLYAPEIFHSRASSNNKSKIKWMRDSDDVFDASWRFLLLNTHSSPSCITTSSPSQCIRLP